MKIVDYLMIGATIITGQEILCLPYAGFFNVIFLEASPWPLYPGPLIIGSGSTIHATICALPSALPSAHYHLHTTIGALPSAVQPDDSWY